VIQLISLLTDKKRKKFLNDNPKTKIVGVGGAGTNMISHLYLKNIAAELISINTDWRQLSSNKADKKVMIGFGEAQGLGCGGDTDKGRRSAIESKNEIRAVLEDTELAIFVGGLGRGTCSGSLPVIAEEAKKKGALVVAFLTIPFFMRKVTLDKTQDALDQLEQFVDTLILLDNNKLKDLSRDLPFLQALVLVDNYVANSVGALISLIREQELMEVDYSDIKSVLDNGGLGTIGIAQIEASGNVGALVKEAVHNKLMWSDVANAGSALVEVIGDSTLSLRTLKSVMDGIKSYIGKNAEVLVSAKIDETLKGQIRLVVILAGMAYAELTLKKEVIGLSKLERIVTA